MGKNSNNKKEEKIYELHYHILRENLKQIKILAI